MKVFWTLVLKPMITRAGTALSAYLVGAGYAQDQATSVVTGLTIGMAIIYDLVSDALSHKTKI